MVIIAAIFLVLAVLSAGYIWIGILEDASHQISHEERQEVEDKHMAWLLATRDDKEGPL